MAYYHPYGLIYKGEFDSIPMLSEPSKTYKVEIYKKYYNGEVSSLTLSANSVVHTFLEDDPKPAIKGSELELTIVNLNGEIKLKDFYSENDDEYKIQLVSNDYLLFEGYLVQDDCEEIETDIAHEITLNFTDQLALLKDITFDQAVKQAQYTSDGLTEYNGFISFPTDIEYDTYGDRILLPTGVSIVDGNSIIIESDGQTIGAFRVNYIETIFGGAKYIYVDEKVPVYSGSGQIYAKFYVVNSMSLNSAYTLSDILCVCLLNTGMAHQIVYAGSLRFKNDIGAMNEDIFDMKVYVNSFGNENDFDSCYDIIEKILGSLSCTIFFHKRWNIFRYNEMRYYDNYIPVSFYDTYFNYVSSGGSQDWISVRNVGDGSNIEYGLLSSIVRPLQYVQRKLEYKQPKSLLNNENILDTGKLVSTSVQVDKTVYRYDLVDWKQNLNPQTIPNSIFIQVDIDNFGNEIDRYIYITDGYDDSPIEEKLLESKTLYVVKGDRGEFSFEYLHQTSNINDPMRGYNVIELTNGVDTYRFISSNEEEGEWVKLPVASTTYYVTRSYWDEDDYKSANINLKEFPISGKLTFYLPRLFPMNYPDAPFVKLRNFQFKYTPYTGGKLPVNGHIHLNKWYLNIRNNEDKEMFIDTILKPSISGSLILSVNESTGVLEYVQEFDESVTATIYKLGQIIVGQEHNWRDKIRLKLEGNMFPVSEIETYNNTLRFINPAVILKYDNEPNKSFAFGKIEINYKSNTYNGTIYEMWDSETDADSIENGISSDPRKIYNFEYLYNEK